MTLKTIVALGIVEAAAGIAIQEGLKAAKEKGLFEKAKNCWRELTGKPAIQAVVAE